MKKSTKRTTLAVAGVLTVGALAGVIGTMSYFTDTDSKTNTFTVGDVSIDLYESQLHRENSGRGGSFPALASDPNYCDWNASSTVTSSYGNATLINGSYENARYCTPGMDAGNTDGISALGKSQTNTIRQWGYSDQTIKDDAEKYKATADATTGTEDGYFTTVASNVVPGEWVRKFAYVENTGNNDAFVLIRYMVPESYVNYLDIKIPGTPYEEDADSTIDGKQPYFLAVTNNNGTYTAYDAIGAADGIDSYTGYTQEIDGVTYRVFAAITNKVLTPGEMTFWSPVNNVRIKSTTAQTELKNLLADNAIDIKVEAVAIQSAGFANGVEAFTALESQ